MLDRTAVVQLATNAACFLERRYTRAETQRQESRRWLDLHTFWAAAAARKAMAHADAACPYGLALEREERRGELLETQLDEARAELAALRAERGQ